MREQIKKIIACPRGWDSLSKLLVVLIILYLILFGAEVILPGMIIQVFNINILLAGIFGILIVQSLVVHDRRKSNSEPRAGKINWMLLALLLVFLSIILVIALYKVALWESLLYFVLTVLISRMLYKSFW